jgi:hypothetical protein
VPVKLPAPPGEIKIISHSTLFYWWPVWAAGFIMAGLTALEGTRMTAVHYSKKASLHSARFAQGAKGTLEYKEQQEDQNASTKYEVKDQDVLIAPEDSKHLDKPGVMVAPSKNLGVFFTLILLLVIVITNIPLRGLWSVMVIVLIVLVVIILALLRVWNDILNYVGFLDIRINLAGYLTISVVLFTIWCIVVFLFDKQLYVIFQPGQLRVRLEIGEGETIYDAAGMTSQKQRSDLFRHWILGLGSGDLIVRTSGAQAHQFDLPNVLFLGRKLKEIEELQRMRQVTTGNP